MLLLYISFVRSRHTATPDEVRAKSEQWWQGEQPDGFDLRSATGALGANAPDVYVFEASEHADIAKLVRFWSFGFDIDVFPAVDLLSVFREQGMEVK